MVSALASIASLLLSVYITTTNCDNFLTIKVTISFKARNSSTNYTIQSLTTSEPPPHRIF